jgi:hypothetical protein
MSWKKEIAFSNGKDNHIPNVREPTQFIESIKQGGIGKTLTQVSRREHRFEYM